MWAAQAEALGETAATMARVVGRLTEHDRALAELRGLPGAGRQARYFAFTQCQPAMCACGAFFSGC